MFCGRWVVWETVIQMSSKCHPILDDALSHKTPILGYFYYTTLFTLYKSPEKKWHRSVKKDIYKCPFFKRVEEVCAKGPLKNTLWAYCFELCFLLIFIDCILFWVAFGPSGLSQSPSSKNGWHWRTDLSWKLLRMNCANETTEVSQMIDKYKIECYPTIKDHQVIEFDAKPTKDTLSQFLNAAL